MRQGPHGSRWAQRSELALLTELFGAYQQKTGRSFAQADTIHLLTETPTEISGGYAPYAGLVWNSTDTIAFELTYDASVRPVRRQVRYRPFLTPCQPPLSDCSRQVLVRLVASQQFEAAKRLARDNAGLDGSRTQVVSATKTAEGYRIVSFTLPAFALPLSEQRQFR